LLTVAPPGATPLGPTPAAAQTADPAVPAGCPAEKANPQDWFASVSSSATSIVVTYESTIPVSGSGGFSLQVCTASGPGTYTNRQFGPGAPVAGGTVTVTTDSFHQERIVIRPDTDYWIRTLDSYGSVPARNSAWQYIRTLPLRSEADAHPLVGNLYGTKQNASNAFSATSFTTGPDAAGYTLTGATVRFGIFHSSLRTSASIRNDNGSGRPGDTVIAELTTSSTGMLGGDVDVAFAAPSGTRLAANTTYWLLVNSGVSSNRATVALTRDSTERPVLPGWSIGDVSFHRSDESATWGGLIGIIQFKLEGFVTPPTLVSTIGQAESQSLNLASNDVAAGFTTGSNKRGYQLSLVGVQFGTAAPVGVSVKLATGLPGATTEVATLTNPDTLAPGPNLFAAPAGTVLSPNTTYYVVVAATTGLVSATAATAEDTGGADGWSVADTNFTRNPPSTGTWQASSDNEFRAVPRIRVDGMAVPFTAPGKPAAPTATATSPVSVNVTWTAPSDPGPSGTVSDYDVRYYQGDADPTDPADWVEEGEDGAAPDPGMDLEVDVIGLTPNTTYRVQVRAQDGEESPWSDSTAVTTPMAVAGATALASNIDEDDHASARADLAAFDWGQDIYTGTSPHGYTLSTVEVDFATKPSDDVEVLIRPRTDVGMRPIRATLVNPAALAAGNNTFTAPTGTLLAPNTRYFVIVRGTSGQLSVKTRTGGFGNCAPTDAPCVGPTRYHFNDGRTDREFINPQIGPAGPLGIRVNGISGLPPVQLGSNVGRIANITRSLNLNDLAAEFRTGSHSAGYTLSDVEIRFSTTPRPSGTTVKLATLSDSSTASSYEFDEVATLANPATLAGGINRFTAPAGTTLEPNTSYFVTVEGTAGHLVLTNSDVQDEGFEIGDSVVSRTASSTGPWLLPTGSPTPTMIFRINGFAQGPTAPAKPRAPTVAATTPVSLNVSWEEPSHAGVIGEVDDYDVRYYQGDADPTDESDWLREYQPGGPPNPGTNRSIDITGLSPGTTYRFQVRANDGGESPWSDSASAITQPALENPEVLISNLGVSDHASDTADLATHEVGNWFTTGSHPGGYLLGSVELNFATRPTGVRVVLQASGGSPIHLANPASLTAGVNLFTAPAGTVLQANLLHHLTITGASGTLKGKRSTEEDPGGKAGWSIASNARVRSKSDRTMTVTLAPLGIRVNGLLGPTALGSNIGQTLASSTNLASSDVAGAFTTGSNATGYTLSDVEVRFSTAAPTGVSVKLATGLPSATTEVATFTNPTTLTAGANKFTAPSGTPLAPGTTYYVVVEAATGEVGHTASDDEDTGVTEFTIGDLGFSRNASSTGSWTSGTATPLIRVNGWVDPLTRPSRPAAPTVTATSHVGLSVSWAPPSFLGPGGAVDDYDLRWYQGDADPEGEGDWVEEGEAGAWPDPGANTSVEVSGLSPNTTYRVQVRAHGGDESDWSPSASATTPPAVGNIRVLTSNIDQTDHATLRGDLSSSDWAQDFNTGMYADGYLLDSVEVDFATAPAGVEVFIRPRGDSGFGPVVATLVNPASLVAGNNTFTAPAGTKLDPSTRYMVIVSGASGDLSVKTGADDDDGGTAGWSVGATRFTVTNGKTAADIDGTFPTPQAPLGIRVRGAPAPRALGSNINQPLGVQRLASFQQGAISFTTGSNRAGYTLTDVEVRLEVVSYSEPLVKLATGRLGALTEVATLINPATPTSGINRFTAPDGTTLSPGTTYYLVVGGRGTETSARFANSGADDSGVTEFTMGDQLLFRTGDAGDLTGTWLTTNEPLSIRVNGTIDPGTAPSRPAAPAVTATSPVSLNVSWTPPIYLGPVGAVDDYDLRWYQGDADPVDEADWVEEGEAGAWPDPGTDTSVEVLGLRPNTAYRVQVRAHGGDESPWSPSASGTTQMALSGARVLVSNIDDTDAPANDTRHAALGGAGGFDFGQDFWTGGYAGGYLLGDVEVRFHTAPDNVDDVEVLIRARGDSGFGPVLATLANPASIVVDAGRLGGNTFTAPAGTVLDPNTRYYVIVRGASGVLRVKNARGADCGPADAWCVGPTRYHFTDGRTDREFINPQLTPEAPLGIRVRGAENDQTLISNMGQPRTSGLGLSSDDLGVMFRTGSHAAGYALSDVELDFRSAGAAPAGIVVKLATCAAPCVAPITLNDVATLVNPATLASGINTFTAPAAGIRLMPYSEYWVTVEGSAGSPWGTNSNGEDAGGFSGFAIGDRGFERAAASTGSWSQSGTASASIKLLARVNGTAVAARVTGVEITSDPGAGDVYGVGEPVDVSVTFSEGVTVSGTPRLKLSLADDGSEERWAVYHRGSGTNVLVFRYTPVAGDNSAGVAVVENSLERDRGTIRTTSSGDPVVLTHTGLAADPEHQVDTLAPRLIDAVYTGGSSFVLLFNEDLDEARRPLRDQIRIASCKGLTCHSDVPVTRRIKDNRVELGGVGLIAEPDRFAASYSYAPNTANVPIKDLAGNEAATFSNEWVRTVSAPSFDDGASATLSIDENNAATASVGTVAATDADGGSLLYSLVPGGDASSFTINSTTGEIKVASGVTLNFEDQDQYTVTALVTDGDDRWGQSENVTRGAATVVSNTGQTDAGNDVEVGDVAGQTVLSGQAFTTGGHIGGYSLTEVGLHVSAWNGNLSNTTAEIWSADASGLPASLLYTLANPVTATDGAVNTFTAAAVLDPDTTYVLVLSVASGTVTVTATASGDEDPGAASGWSIADGDAEKLGALAWGQGADRPLRISVTAAEFPFDDLIAVTINVGNVNEPPGAPTGLMVTDRTARTLTLEWTAAAAAAEGPAPDSYDLRWFAGSTDPTAGNEADWVEPGEEGGHTSPGTGTTTTLEGLTRNTAYRVQVRAGSPDGPGLWSASVGATTSDDPPITLAVSPTSVDEGDSAAIRISASRDLTDTTDEVTVQVTAQAASTATSGADYTAFTVPDITIPENTVGVNQSFTIATIEDSINEGVETIVLGGTVSGTTQFDVISTTFTINDDDETSAAITSDPGKGDLYGVGEPIEMSLTFSESVTVDTSGGTPRLKIRLSDDASSEKRAGYHSGSGSRVLVFRYLPVAGDSSDGVAVVENSLVLNGGTIKSTSSSDDVLLGHPGIDADPEHKIKTTPPTLVEAVCAGSGAAVRVALIFSENLDGDSHPHTSQLTLSDGSDTAAMSVVAIEGNRLVLSSSSSIDCTASNTFEYDYVAGTLTHVPIRDVAGNEAAPFTGADAVAVRRVSDPSFDDGATATFSIDENNADAASVGTVAATDADGDTLTYSLAPGTDASSFTISSTGEINVASGTTLNHEAQDSYTVTAQVTDGKDAWGQDLPSYSGTLVSNTGQPDLAFNLGVGQVGRPNSSFAMAFTTGAETDGYVLASIGVNVHAWNGNLANTTAEIWSTTAAGLPDSRLFPLTNPDTAVDGAVNTFAAPSGARLEPNTTYALVLAVSTGRIDVKGTQSDSEDSGAASGWSIANSHASRRIDLPGSTWSLAGSGAAVEISVNAPVLLPDDTIAVTINVSNVNEPPPAAPAGLTVTGRTGRTLTLEWTAVAAATGGPDPDSYDVRWFEGSTDPAAGNEADWVEPGEEGGHSSPGAGTTTVLGALGGLKPSTAYRVQVRANSPDGPGPWSASVDGTTSDEPDITLTVNPASVDEGDSASVTVTASRVVAESPDPVAVQVLVQAGSTATSGTDYTAFTVEAISIAENAASESVSFTIATTGDSVNEGDETIVLGATVDGFGVVAATFTIVDDDDETSVAITSDPGMGDLYGVGEPIEVSLTLSENVTVTGTPRLKIRLSDDASSERWAGYHSGSGSTV
ncbi:MAG: hypothetical protein F4Z31_12405, partial [Gemmatimonadetes bacterium]|nr:hypothetical protein [Gemmatimonadota bacterium]